MVMVKQYGPAPSCLASGMQGRRLVTRRRLLTMLGNPVDSIYVRVILANNTAIRSLGAYNVIVNFVP